jgi:photosystem II stability/assembly factor-like uncharacterized protein
LSRLKCYLRIADLQVETDYHQRLAPLAASVGKTWQRFDKVTPHGTLMSVGLHHGDARQIYVAARYGEVFGTQDGGESWLEMPLPQGVQHI